ncbi:MAG: hypothetical protein ACR2LK_05830 [Solirubrobacteraceae bacterium]
MSQPTNIDRQLRNVYRRRRATAAAVVAVPIIAIALALRSGDDDTAVDAEATAPAAAPAQLPRGGRRIFPEHRVVAFYGAPQSRELGELGIGTPASAAKRLRRAARPYERKTRPVLPAFELISTIATADAGRDGMYRMHQPAKTIERYLAGARKAKALLLLDIQPGRDDFLSEAKRLQKWLLQPDVGLALDPEWHVGADEVPGKTLGSVTAQKVNEVAAYLSDLIRKHDLPEKLFIIHQFTDNMISEREQLRDHPGLAVTLNIDGFGDRPNKVSKYNAFTEDQPRFNDGFKLFYEEDTNLMSPRAVLALGPPPDLIVYE